MTHPPRHLVPPHLREALVRLGWSLLAGALIGALIAVEDLSRMPLVAIAGAWIGACIFLSTVPIGWVLDPWLDRQSDRTRRAALALVFFVAGGSGWLLAVATLPWITFGAVRLSIEGWRTSLGVAGILGVLVGLAIVTWETLRRRLATSVARIKEMEFAERELATAREIQSRLLSPTEFETDGWRIRARNRPAGFVAGDFYDYFRLSDGRLAAVVADVSGKGTGASLLMASAKAILPFVVDRGGGARALSELNRRLADQLAPREFVALALVLIRLEDGVGELANAGLPDPYLLRGTALRTLATPGPRLPLGLRREISYESVAFTLEPGDRLLLVTDGPPEAPVGDTDEPIGYERFANLIEGASRTPDPLETLFADVEAFSGSAPTDDWTALLLERALPEPHTATPPESG